MPTLSEIHCYPVKSCRGIALSRRDLDDYGIRDDRSFMLVDESGDFVTQRGEPRLALVHTAFEGSLLRLEAPGLEPLRLPLAGEPGSRREVRVWSHRGPGVDQGDPAAEWFGAHLGRTVRLVRIPAGHRRRVDPARAPDEAHTAFQDAFPLLLVSEGSLRDLNGRLKEPAPMNRFRPNLVVSGCRPYAEDGWSRIRIGRVELALVKDCPRCAVIGVDQETALRRGDPLRVLAGYRRRGDGAVFGRNAVHLGRGRLEVGDEVNVLEERAPGAGGEPARAT